MASPHRRARTPKGTVLTSVWGGDPFVAIDVSDWDSADEPMGSRRKAWLRPPDEPDAPMMLMKWARRNEPQDGTAPALWAEILAVQVADAMGVPCARVRLARGADRTYATLARAAAVEGALLLSGRYAVDELVHGNELLSSHDLSYEAQTRGKNPGYALAAVRAALSGRGSLVDGLSAFDCFAGFLAFDAVIANTDRHHENWGVMAVANVLAPTFDHGTALGFNVSSASGVDAAAYAARGRTRHFADGGTLIELANRALGMASSDARQYWRAAVEGIEVPTLRDTCASIPVRFVSEARRTFMIDLVDINRRRLLDEHR